MKRVLVLQSREDALSIMKNRKDPTSGQANGNRIHVELDMTIMQADKMKKAKCS